jgi:hypothetical protein
MPKEKKLSKLITLTEKGAVSMLSSTFGLGTAPINTKGPNKINFD